MLQMSIGKSTIGDGLPPYIIAEVGVNHNGKLTTACELIRQAAECGANAVKFQTFSADRIATQAAPKALYQQRNTHNNDPQYAMLKALEVPEWWYPRLLACCTEVGVDFISTPYDVVDIAFLAEMDIAAYKVPSAWAVESEYLDAIAGCGKPVLLSTGMCTIGEVAAAVEILRARTDQLVILHCTTDYPTRPEDCNVRVVQTLSRMFGRLVGLSDHSQSPVPAMLAVALGACVVERHFTLDRAASGPDHSSSDTPDALRALVDALRHVHICLGRPEKRPVDSERVNITAMRRSMVAALPIARGARIRREHLGLKRPAIGLAPRLVDRVVGRVALCDIAPDQHLTGDMVDLGPDCGLRLEEVSPHAHSLVLSIFATLSSSDDATWFHPHPFTKEYAEFLCAYAGRDYYALAMRGASVVGYVMLRGWDAGYSVPTAGIYVVPDWRGKRLAEKMLCLLRVEALQRGAQKIYAKIYADNAASLRAFLAAGYTETRRAEGIVHVHASIC